MWTSLGQIGGHLVLQCITIFGSLRLLRRATPWWRIMAFAVLQSFSVILTVRMVPLLELQFLLLSITHILYFMWVFEADLFPDALFAYLIPLSLQALGEFTLQPLLAHYIPALLRGRFAAAILGPSGELVPHLPSFLLALYFLFQKTEPVPDDQKTQGGHGSGVYAGWMAVFLVTSLCCCVPSSPAGSLVIPRVSYRGFFFKAHLLAFPFLVFTLHRYSQRERESEKVLQYHVKRGTVQETALRTLREERHDLLNELTLISTYVQMGKNEEALSSIAYSAAKLSDRHNYSTLPADAWITVLEIKRREAERLGIAFSLDLEAEPPHCFHEQRLLPKVIMNLVDNAFAAVSQQEAGEVKLSWSVDAKGQRVLAVSNNGPEISCLEGKRIFRGGVTSKEDPSNSHGWGLVICKRIAEELGGSITFTSSPELTTFALTLPAVAAAQKRASAT
ncbi:sensor histidine kinase [Candidatus Darwinibacter acetoxidans]|jgi:two-component sensor histidine kinase